VTSWKAKQHGFARTTTTAIAAVILAAGVRAGSATERGQPGAFELSAVLAQAGARVEEFFTRAQSLVCTETVSLQPLSSGLTSDGFSRTVVSELRVSWDPGLGGPVTEAQTRRQVVAVNGRPPRDDDDKSCTTPEQTETETQPLSMLLSDQRARYEFSAAGSGRVAGRAATMIDFREIAPVTADVTAVEGLEDCVSYDLKGGQRGRLWLDAQTFDVLRLDQRIGGMIDLRLPRVLTRRPGAPMYMTLERSDTSLRFGRVSFSQPDESLVLPLEASELRIMRGAGTSRLRTLTKYSDYKRFMTAGRVVG
jgi:hypothetical protein